MTNTANTSESGPSGIGNRRIIAIRGCKGGVGASMIATNLGIFLAQIGKRVLLVDADFSNGAMHCWLGKLQPERFITQVLHEGMTIEKAATTTDITGLYLLAGRAGAGGTGSLSAARAETFLCQLRAVSVDYVIIDLSSDFEDFTLSIFTEADYPILVTAPLPDAVEVTYRFMNAAWLHLLLASDEIQDEKLLAQIRGALYQQGAPVSPREFTSTLANLDSDAGETAKELSVMFHPLLVINQVKIKEDEELGAAMVSAAARWTGLNPMVLGTIGWDENVWLAMRRSRVLLIEFSRSQVCKDLEQVLRRILSLQHTDVASRVTVPPPTLRQNYYQLLEIYPGASEEEIRRAHKQLFNWFGLEGLAVRGAATEPERELLQRRAEEAHARLLDRSVRREYDRKNFPEGFIPTEEQDAAPRDSIAGTVTATHESLPKVVLREGDVVDGAFLGNLRKERGVELADISNRAKVSVRYLKAIEQEKFADLPAAVFTRGFVTEFARFLKVDPRRAATDFMRKYDNWQRKR
ncbi:MAG: helix-turn-helix domain-containing protein [Deltaproteobacteria bacterium]|nr:helix-turn-helix domain-containing protein [Deltaproteobacteria bacterium]